MNPDERFQDFLDDRLSPDERAAFESRIAREPALARRLAEYRALQAALREDEPLPPGFYTRTRAAFEARHARRQRNRLFGVVPWEAVGLTAAAGLALALFVPGLLRDELPGATSLQRANPPTPAAEESVESFADTRPPIAEPPLQIQEKAASLGESSGGPVGAAARPSDANPPPASTQVPKQAAARQEPGVPPAAPEPERARANDPSPAAAPGNQRSFAPSPPRREARPADAPAAALSERSEDAALMGRAQTEMDLRRDAQESLHGGVGPTGARTVPVPFDAVERHSVTSVFDPALLERLIVAAGKNELSKEAHEDAFTEFELAPRLRQGERAVVIGPRDRAFVCEGLRVVTSPTEYVIYLTSPAPAQAAGPTACAVFLPADERTIRVVDPR